jgi:hypothetical protein
MYDGKPVHVQVPSQQGAYVQQQQQQPQKSDNKNTIFAVYDTIITK